MGNEHTTNETTNNKLLWIAMKAAYYSMPTVLQKLKESHIEFYAPTQESCEINSHGKKKTKTNYIGGMLFIHDTRNRVYELERGILDLQYYPNKIGHGVGPLVVPDEQMETFIDFMQAHGKDALFFSPEEINLAKGEPVVIVDGPFDGREGILLKVKGARAKRFVVSIPQLFAVAFNVECEYIRIIKPNKKAS